jgi:hypothetical protein
VNLWPLDRWDCGFESRPRNGYLSVLSNVCCKVEFSATGRSLVKSSLAEYGVPRCDRNVCCKVEFSATGRSLVKSILAENGVPLCDRKASILRRPQSTRGCYTKDKQKSRDKDGNLKFTVQTLSLLNIQNGMKCLTITLYTMTSTMSLLG